MVGRPVASRSRWTTLLSLTSPLPVKPAPCQASARPMPDAWRARPPSAAPARPCDRPLAGALELRGLRGPVEHLLPGHALAQDLLGRGHVAQLIDPATAERERRDTQGVGDPVRLHLRRELGLGRAEPAEGAIGRRVRGHRATPDAHIGTAIRTARVEHAARQHHGRERAVGAAVHDDVDVLGHERAIAHDAGAVADDRRMALGGRRDVLVAVVDHAHWVPRLAGQQRGVDGHDRGVLLLPPEAAAGLGLDDDRLAVAERERPLERGVDVVGALERAVHGDAAVVARDRRSCPGSRCTAAPGGRPGRCPR